MTTSNQSVRKAAAILRAAAARQPEGDTAAGLARAAGLPHPTALRLLRTLEDEGFLVKVGERPRYLLGAELLRLSGADARKVLAAVARPMLEELARSCAETATLSIAHHDAVEIVAQVDGPRLIGVVNWVGGRWPLHASASGKVVLASWSDERVERLLRQPLAKLATRTITDPGELRDELDHVRRQGYATIDDELEDGLFGIGAPVFERGAPEGGRSSRLLGVVNVSGPSFRFDPETRRTAVERLLAAAAAIERAHPHAHRAR